MCALVVVGTAASLLAAGWVGAAPGMYVGKVQVVVHPPKSVTVANPLATQSDSAVRFAGLIAEVATDGEEVPRVTNQDLTLADQGMQHATLISLANLGGQWANDFSRPFVRVEAVDTSAEAVVRRLQNGVVQVNRAMDDLQQSAQVVPSQRATTEMVPSTPQVWYEGTHRNRAMLAAYLLGLTITYQLCRGVGRAFSRPDGRSSRSPASRDGAQAIGRASARDGSVRTPDPTSSRADISWEAASALHGRRLSGDRRDPYDN